MRGAGITSGWHYHSPDRQNRSACWPLPSVRALNPSLRDQLCIQSCTEPNVPRIESRQEEDYMQAAVAPAVNSSWQMKDVPQPQPGPSQVLVEMHASGICYTDVHQTLGHLPGPFPRILGHEPVGEIVAVAPDVTTRKVGDRVGTAWIQSTCGRCEWCQRGRKMFCPYLKGTGIEAQGGHAEYMPMNADATYLIPDKVAYEQAAPIFCAGSAGPIPNRMSAWLCSGSAGLATWPCNTRRLRASKPSRFRIPPIRTR